MGTASLIAGRASGDWLSASSLSELNSKDCSESRQAFKLFLNQPYITFYSLLFLTVNCLPLSVSAEQKLLLLLFVVQEHLAEHSLCPLWIFYRLQTIWCIIQNRFSWAWLDFYAQLTILLLKDAEVTCQQWTAKVVLTGDCWQLWITYSSINTQGRACKSDAFNEAARVFFIQNLLLNKSVFIVLCRVLKNHIYSDLQWVAYGIRWRDAGIILGLFVTIQYVQNLVKHKYDL